MGKLRTEPKQKSFLSQAEFDELLSVLKEAQKASADSYVFYDLDAEEKPSMLRKAFSHVARKASVDVVVRQVRGSQSLAFQFKRSRGGNSRMSADESKNRILKCLQKSNEPLKKNQIIKETGISPSTWNIRIKELLKEKLVARQGDRRDTTYTYAG